MSDMVELKSLARKCRKGNRDCQKKFYMHYHSFALRICLRYAGNRDHAVHIMNESFYAFFTNADLTGEEISIEALLGKIIVDSVINDYNKMKNTGCYVHSKSDMQENDIRINTVPHKDTLSILQTLPDLDRIIFNMYVMDQYSHQQIAKQLKIDVKESGLRLQAARVALKSSL